MSIEKACIHECKDIQAFAHWPFSSCTQSCIMHSVIIMAGHVETRVLVTHYINFAASIGKCSLKKFQSRSDGGLCSWEGNALKQCLSLTQELRRMKTCLAFQKSETRIWQQLKVTRRSDPNPAPHHPPSTVLLSLLLSTTFPSPLTLIVHWIYTPPTHQIDAHILPLSTVLPCLSDLSQSGHTISPAAPPSPAVPLSQRGRVHSKL